MTALIKRHFLFVFGFFFFVTVSLAQTSIKIEGKVIDSENRKPIEGVYVSVNKTNIGTITNANGSYQLIVPANITNPELVFSYIGCENKVIKLNEDKEGAKFVVLKGKPFKIDEIIIVPDSFLRSLLRRAYRNIKVNYPTEPTNSDGFYREDLSRQTDRQLIYFNEGFFKIYTGSYDGPVDVQTKLIKSSKHVISGMDTALESHRWISGGVQFKHNDFVLTKEEFIDPFYYRNYKYQIRRQTIFNGDSVYEIEFSAKKSSARFNGVMYIETKSLAYVAAFYGYNEDFLQEDMGLVKTKRLTRTRKIYYQKVQDKWVLREFKYQTIFKDGNSNEVYVKNIEGLNTITTFNGKDGYIPYEERDLDRTIFVDQAQVNDSADWEENTIIVNDSVFNEQYIRSEAIKALDASNKTKKGKKQKKSFADYISNLSVGKDFGYYTFTSRAANVKVNSDYIDLSKNIPAYYSTRLFAGSVYYYLTRNWRIAYGRTQTKPSQQLYYNAFELGASWKKCIRKRGRPLFIIPELLFARTVWGYKLGPVWGTNGMKLGNKTIKTSSFNLYSGTLEWAARTNLRLLYALTPIYKIGLTASYYFPFRTKNVYIGDKSLKTSLFNSGFVIKPDELSGTTEYRSLPDNFLSKGRYSFAIGIFIDFK